MIIPYIASDLREVSPTVLAYIGDSVYELYARCHVATKFAGNNNKMHKKNVGYVSAVSQAKAMHILESELDEEEESFFRRGRNSNPHSASKNASPADYMYATGFETLIGFLFLDNRSARLEYIIARTFEILDAE
ncbi:ribonuclease-3 family protein [Ruminococcaceae bacterium YRB3002]|nr:ribonuclease-3 family protein [Ruminococcaceae bacterium YRB3002]